MIITADSGSTSIDWRILRRGEPVRRLVSPGVNPVLQGVEAMRGVFSAALKDVVERTSAACCNSSMENVLVYFYGAGVVSEAAAGKVRVALQAVLPGCEVTAGSDLEAAAIALLGDKDGVAAILGTGSNSGLYLGGRIVRNIPAGGFILGDEGSGAWLGKMLLADYIKGLLPQELETALLEELPGLDYPAVVSRVYGPRGTWLRSPFSWGGGRIVPMSADWWQVGSVFSWSAMCCATAVLTCLWRRSGRWPAHTETSCGRSRRSAVCVRCILLQGRETAWNVIFPK